jgi:hypothetical protein
VCVFVEFGVFSRVPSMFVCLLTSFSPTPCPPVIGAGGPSSGEVRPPRSIELRARLVLGPVRRP